MQCKIFNTIHLTELENQLNEFVKTNTIDKIELITIPSVGGQHEVLAVTFFTPIKSTKRTGVL